MPRLDRPRLAARPFLRALLVARMLLAAACVAAALLPWAPALASGIDTLAVRYRDDAVAPGATSMPEPLRSALAAQLGDFTVTGVARDGSFNLKLAAPLDIDTLRERLNVVRLAPEIVYANVATTATGAAGGPPTNRLIVKYRDPLQVMRARSGVAPSATQIDHLASVAGVALAWVRGMYDGGDVLMLLTRLPVAQVEAIAALLSADAQIDYAQPDYIRTAQLTPSDPCYASASIAACNGNYQWDLFDPTGGINMPAAWDITTGSAAINVAVIDTGALFNHPDLAGRFVGGYDMIADCAVANDGQPGPCTWMSQSPDMASRDSDASDPGDWVTSQENTGLGSSGPPYNWFQNCSQTNSSWHGSHVAGTIGATPNNGIGIVGINWVSKIVPVRVLGKCGGYTADIADAIVWAAGGNVPPIANNPNPARVLSLSLGGSGACDTTSQGAITTANNLNAVVVVAAGNSNANAANFSPASCNGVITVAATNKSGRRSWYSNYGATVEIAAPGGSGGTDSNGQSYDAGVLSSINSGATSPVANGYIYANYSGTSMATPHVSGVVSLMLSVNPALTPAQVLSKLQTTARAFPTPGPACAPTPATVSCNCTTALCGAGILNAAAAVAASVAGVSVGLGSSANPAAVNTPVTFTATVTGNAPTGSVNFKDGGATFGGCGAVALTGSGNSKTAQCATSSLAVGAHSIVATYSGDANNASTSSTALSQTITLPATTTTLASSSNPAAVNTPVTFTATVAGTAPTGTVNFTDGGTTFGGCGAVALTGSGNSKTAQCTTSSLAAGSHSIVATYGGDAGNAGSSSTALSQAINAPLGTTLTSNNNPAVAGSLVTLTATVVGTTHPTGTVNFMDGGASITGCSSVPVSGAGNTATANCATSSFSVGTHSLTASYSGERSGNPPSTSTTLSQVVTSGGGPTTSTTAVSSNLNPSTVGAAVTFTATVTGTAPTGNVDFRDGASSITGCSAQPLSGSGNSRTATCTTSALAQGTHSITANYGGDAGNTSSASSALSQGVNPAGQTTSTTALASAPNPSNSGASVTFTATVSGTAPTGTVNFKDGAASVAGCAAVALTGSGNARTAMCATSALSVGAHSMTAVYGGDAGNTSSTSNTVSQVVNACVGRGC